MGYYLLEHKNPHGPHFYEGRQSPLLACVIHITAGLQGSPAGVDSSAEKTAAYAAQTDRKVSWHSGSDTDTHLLLLPDQFTAFHCQGYNSKTIGHEISKNDTKWADEDPKWVTETLHQAAACLRPRLSKAGIPLVKINRSQLDAGHKGLIAHSDLDPQRRSDPGPDFPWSRFLQILKTTGDRTLRLTNPEMTGNDVANVQKGLNTLGNSIKVDGVYGRQTADVVNIFKANRGITEPGFGPQCWKALRAAVHG